MKEQDIAETILKRTFHESKDLTIQSSSIFEICEQNNARPAATLIFLENYLVKSKTPDGFIYKLNQAGAEFIATGCWSGEKDRISDKMKREDEHFTWEKNNAIKYNKAILFVSIYTAFLTILLNIAFDKLFR